MLLMYVQHAVTYVYMTTLLLNDYFTTIICLVPTCTYFTPTIYILLKADIHSAKLYNAVYIGSIDTKGDMQTN